MTNNLKLNLREAYNNQAGERDKNDMQQWKEEQRTKFLGLIKKENKKSLLELGAGPGRDSMFFMNEGFDVIATDLSSEMIKLCKAKGLNAFEMDFSDIHTLNKTFDAVWALNCLLHVEKKNLPGVLKEINSVLKPNGLFFMGVYGGQDSEGIWEEDFYNPPRFFSFFTDEKLKHVVSQYFDIISFETIETEGKYNFQALILRKR